MKQSSCHCLNAGVTTKGIEVLILSDRACIEIRFWLKLVQFVLIGAGITLCVILVQEGTLDHVAHLLLWCALTGYAVIHYFLSLIP